MSSITYFNDIDIYLKVIMGDNDAVVHSFYATRSVSMQYFDHPQLERTVIANKTRDTVLYRLV